MKHRLFTAALLAMCTACSDFALTANPVVATGTGTYEKTFEGTWRALNSDSASLEFRYYDKWDGAAYKGAGFAILQSARASNGSMEYFWTGKAEVMKLASGNWLLDLQTADEKSDDHDFRFRNGKPMGPRFQNTMPAFGMTDYFSTSVTKSLDLHLPLVCSLSATKLSCKPFMADSIKTTLRAAGAANNFVVLNSQFIVTAPNSWSVLSKYENRAGFLGKATEFARR